jgi:hypothetical protein
VNWAMPISDCSIGQHWLKACRIAEREMSAGWYCAWKKRVFPVASAGVSSWHTVGLVLRSSRRAASWKIGEMSSSRCPLSRRWPKSLVTMWR